MLYYEIKKKVTFYFISATFILLVGLEINCKKNSPSLFSYLCFNFCLQNKPKISIKSDVRNNE